MKNIWQTYPNLRISTPLNFFPHYTHAVSEMHLQDVRNAFVKCVINCLLWQFGGVQEICIGGCLKYILLWETFGRSKNDWICIV